MEWGALSEAGNPVSFQVVTSEKGPVATEVKVLVEPEEVRVFKWIFWSPRPFTLGRSSVLTLPPGLQWLMTK